MFLLLRYTAACKVFVLLRRRASGGRRFLFAIFAHRHLLHCRADSFITSPHNPALAAPLVRTTTVPWTPALRPPLGPGGRRLPQGTG